jgi:uncharacterized protein YndB with AHSA1/START domain
MSVVQTDRIEKQILLRAPRKRVWQALTTVSEFNEWFGVKLTGTFTPGARLRGQVTHKGYEHLTMEVTIDKVEPERLLSWRWHPGATEPAKDYSAEAATLVVFELAEVDGGTMLSVVESGFDRIPATRREQAYRENEDGWTQQMESIKRHVSQTS